ncbi:hypothetical protein ABID22_003600 [Pontibacter aydingkolensis]|uniref:Uncharacterized protein n=1 Tax=Pontibacter aydingkolensis TaxID=1911536 RepID=A0ABS7CZJ4_9BACT|nr:hypothetical protein [Pontibacter aydingkolensis]MBW7468942.1 hypothetical protein [Pontibacter aydingkolensis]
MIRQATYNPTYPPTSFAENETVVDNKLSINYDEHSETLEIKWEGSVNSHEVRQGYSVIMEYVQLYKPAKWLLDLHSRDKIKRSDQRWVFTYFFPEALRVVGSNVFVAVILPVSASHELVHELDGDELIQNENFMIINHFLYREAAQRWLSLDKSVKAGA